MDIEQAFKDGVIDAKRYAEESQRRVPKAAPVVKAVKREAKVKESAGVEDPKNG